MSCREALAAAQNDVGSMRAAQLGDRERLEAALETEAALRREVTQLAATREQLEAALAQGLDRADFFVQCYLDNLVVIRFSVPTFGPFAS